MWWRRIIGGHCCLAPLLLLRPLSTLSPPSIVPTLLHPSHRGWMCGAFGICAVRSGGRSNVPYGGRSGVGERTAGGWRSRVSTCPTIGLSYLPGQRRPGPLWAGPLAVRLVSPLSLSLSLSDGLTVSGLLFFFPRLAPPTNADCTHTQRLVPIQTLYAAHGHTSARGIDRGNLTSVIDVYLYTPSPTADATRRNPTLRRRNAKRKVRNFPYPSHPPRRNFFCLVFLVFHSKFNFPSIHSHRDLFS
jgi:hypothetical protein